MRCVMILVLDHSVSMIDISVQVWKWSMGSLWLLIATVTMLVSAMLALWETTVRCVPPLLTPSQGQACTYIVPASLCNRGQVKDDFAGSGVMCDCDINFDSGTDCENCKSKYFPARTAISFTMSSAQIVAVRVSITLYLDAYALLVKLT